MKTIEKWKVWVFVGLLTLIALVVNTGHEALQGEKTDRRRAQDLQVAQERLAMGAAAEATEERKADEQRKVEDDRKATEARKAAAEKKAAEEAAATHARFLARYLNRSIPRNQGIQKVAIAVASETDNVDHALYAALTNRFKADSVEILPGFFRPDFVSDGLLNRVLAGSTEILRNLELTNALDLVVLARQAVEYVPNPSLENVLTANMRLEVATFSVAGSAESQKWTFTANGAGFKEADARSLAEERLMKQIASDTNMSLTH